MSRLAAVRAPDARPSSPQPDAGVASLRDVVALETLRPDPLGAVSSTYDLLRQGAALHPQAPALSFFLRPQDHARPHTWTHSAWLACITRAANALHQLGVQRGDAVAFIL